ncbi:DUF302 domain-containing protein [Magnetovibrio sp. PR-2]|uniref:DUF302 domain-containing protein n=1 Tax=Magnetovibrio sp. PR-2 TaxID=3120356 RepID=UPI002FCE4E2A
MTKSVCIILALALFVVSPMAHAGETTIVSTTVEGTFEDTSSAVKEAIIGKGINIAHVLPASDMLNRTGPAFGYTKGVYDKAEIYEFCSAAISQKLARIDPANIVLCPFTIGVYTLPENPGEVHITYKIPTGKPGSEQAVEEIQALISSIVEDASW